MKQKTIEDVLRALTNLGYERAEHGFFGFSFYRQHDFNNKKASLDYNRYSGEHGEFVVSTVSSHWTVEESEEFIKQLVKATDEAKTLNLIIKRGEM
jgi:trehalose-6-phosphatase